MAASAAEVQKIVDEALETPKGTGRPTRTPDRETWGATPEDIAAQNAMMEMARKGRR